MSVHEEVAVECLDAGRGGCSGPVEYRTALSPSGRNFPRCEAHWMRRLDIEAETTARLGHWRSDVPPPGFDPLDAGERWEDD